MTHYQVVIRHVEEEEPDSIYQTSWCDSGYICSAKLVKIEGSPSNQKGYAVLNSIDGDVITVISQDLFAQVLVNGQRRIGIGAKIVDGVEVEITPYEHAGYLFPISTTQQFPSTTQQSSSTTQQSPFAIQQSKAKPWVIPPQHKEWSIPDVTLFFIIALLMMLGYVVDWLIRSLDK